MDKKRTDNQGNPIDEDGKLIVEKINRQVKREDGELLILTSNDAVASLSTLPYDLSFGGKGSEKTDNSK